MKVKVLHKRYSREYIANKYNGRYKDLFNTNNKKLPHKNELKFIDHNNGYIEIIE